MENTPIPPTSSTPEAGQTAAAKITINPVDFQKLRDVTDELMKMQLSHSENASKVLDKVFKAHENGASFYEKLILFNVGTIALSLTLLGQIVAHTPGGHVPRHPFIWYLCPAWFLLLVSIQGCAQRIVGFHNANTLLVQQMSTLFSEDHGRHLSVIVARFSSLVGDLALPNEHAQKLYFSNPTQENSDQRTQTFSTVFANMNEALGKALKEESSRGKRTSPTCGPS
jgi:hypothetical protein